MPNDVTTKADLIALTEASYDALQREIDGLTDAQLYEPGVIEDWSVKDIIAHISGWERLFTGWMEALLRGELPDRPQDIAEAWVNATNARLYEEARHRSPEAVRMDAAEWHAALMALLDRLTEADLFDPKRFPLARGREIAPWVRGNADEHYDEHRDQIAAWKQRRR